MIITYKYKLYRTKKLRQIHQDLNVSSWIYNHCISLHKRYYRLYGKYLNMYQLQKHLTKLKKLSKYHTWKQVPSQAVQEITERIHKGYQKFFDNLKAKNKRKVSPPSYKGWRKYKSIKLKKAGFKFNDDNTLRYKKTIFKYWKSRPIEGNIKCITFKRDVLGDFYICVTCDLGKDFIEDANRTTTGNVAGIDFSMKNLLVTSNPDLNEYLKQLFEVPEFFKKSYQVLKKAHRELSSKKKGSNNRKRAIKNLYRKYRRIDNQRRDYQYKLARFLCKFCDFIVIEDLNIDAMKRLWGRKISELGWSRFVKILTHVGNKLGTIVEKVGKFFPSSKTCSCCKHVNKDLNIKQRTWICPNCNVNLDRDLNAAVNILWEGVSSHRGDIVSLSEMKANIVDPRIPTLKGGEYIKKSILNQVLVR